MADLWVAIASISSKKIIQGLQDLARLNRFLTAFSDYPTYLENSSEPFTDKKLSFDSVAIALAIIVLLHPGGPYNKIPFNG